MKPNEAIFIVRQNIITFYKRHEQIILPILKFIIVLAALNLLKSETKYTAILSKPIIMIGIAALSAFISIETFNIIAIILIALFTISYHMIFGVSLFILMSVIYLLYIRLFPKQGILILVTIFAFSIKAELLVPIVCGLFGTYVCIISIIIGTLIWFYLPVALEILSSVGLDKEMLVESIGKMLSADMKPILINPNLTIMIIIMSISFAVIYIIRKQSIDYGPYIAIVVGGIMNIVGFGLTIILVDYLQINFIVMAVKVIVFCLIACVLQFFSIVLDYQRSENLSFEDEDNFYYVKIVPKIHILGKKQVIKKIYTSPTKNKDELSKE